jgi:hypothetical protein
MKKALSMIQALMFLTLILSPVVKAEEREQTIDIEFLANESSGHRQNLIDASQITTGMETWAIQPKGVYSGPILAESLMEFNFEVRPNQQTSTLVTTEPVVREVAGMGPGVLIGYDYNLDSDLNCYGDGAISGGPYFNDIGTEYNCKGLEDEWSNSDNSITDPYGRDDVGRIYGDYTSSPDTISYDTGVPLWGENSYHSYFAVSVPVQFSHSDIMSGASEFWVRAPIDGVYDEANSYISIFEISNLSNIEFEVEPNSILNNTVWNNDWESYGAYNPPEMLRNTKVTHDTGKLIYDNSLDGQNALAFDFSEAVCATVVNGSTNPDAGSDSYISSNGKNIEGTQPTSNMWCPENNFPIVHSEAIPVHSEQTLHIPSIVEADIYRTYHRVNTFIYPNQPYLFVFLLEIEESNPMIAWTPEDANGLGTNTFLRYGEYNFSNPFDSDGQLEHLRNPYNHYTNSDTVELDTGTSFVFTQGQAHDMAGYRFHADNTTVSFMKELPEPISHDPGPDELFDWYDGDPAVNDDELDFVSIYFPFINHDRRDITIEYMAIAYEIQDDGQIFLKQWMNASRMDCIDDTNPQGTVPFTGDKYDESCGATFSTVQSEIFFGKTVVDDAKHNYYYSGFWYFGYPEEGLSIRTEGSTEFEGHGPPGYHCDEYSSFSVGGTNCRSDDFQNRAGVLNDEATNPEYFRKQHMDYFLHTSELIPENGTTHILYLFKFAGTHHWQSNIEDVCFYCDAQNPFSPAEFTSHHGATSIDEQRRITSFNSERDTDGDGRTDTNCALYSCQQNTTDITLLIQKPSAKPGQRMVPLPIWGVAMNLTCLSRSTLVFTEGAGEIITGNQTTCPGNYAAPVNAWSIYQEVHDRENGVRIDGARKELIIRSGDWLEPSGIYCGGDRQTLAVGGLNAHGWNVAKPCVEQGSYGDIETKEASGVFEINARSATYTAIEDFEFHSTQLMVSTSITHGRWTETKGTSEGFNFLDNTFRHKIVQKNEYHLTIYASTYEIPPCPVGTEEVDAVTCATIPEPGLIESTMNVLAGINEACNPVDVQNNPSDWDITLDFDKDWGDCAGKIKDGIVDGTRRLATGVVDGSQALYGTILDAFDMIQDKLDELGPWVAKFVTDIIGVITSLFHEIGQHLDELLTGALYLVGLGSLSFFLQLIVRFGTTMKISLSKGADQ